MLNRPTTWREAIFSNNPRHYLLMAVIFNALTVLQLIWVFRLHRDAPYLGVFLIVTVFFLAMLGYYGWSFYQQTQEWLKALPLESAEATALVRITHSS